MTKTILNLGCGNKPYANALNHDITQHADYVDVVHNLNLLPWPWADGQFTAVYALAVLEHLDPDLLTLANEVWRILQPGGRLSVKLPMWNSANTYSDPTHRRGYAPDVFDQLCPETARGKLYGFYTARKWRYVKLPHVNRAGTSFHVTLEKLP